MSQLDQPLLAHSSIVVSPDQLSSKLEDEVIILNMADSAYYGLDPIGTYIWEIIQEPHSIAEILELLLAEYDVSAELCEKTLLDLLRDLQQHQLIRIDNAV
jgi:hypothetical protein